MSVDPLGVALADAIRVGGAGLLDDAPRLRGLVEDGLGADGRSVRADVLILEALAEEGLARRLIGADDAELDNVASALRQRRGIDPAASQPVLRLVRRLTTPSSTDDRPQPRGDPTDVPPSPTELAPTRRRGGLVALAVAVTLIAAVVGFVAGRAGRQPAERATTTSTLPKTVAATGEDGAAKTAGDLQAEQAKSAQLAAQLQAITGQLDQANKSVTSLQAQVQSAGTPAPAQIALSSFDPLGGAASAAYRGQLALSACDNISSCSASITVDITINHRGDGSLQMSSLLFEDASMAREGSSFRAQGTVGNQDYALRCQGVVTTTNFDIRLTPSQMTVASGIATVTGYTVDYVIVSPPGGACSAGSQETYAGLVTKT